MFGTADVQFLHTEFCEAFVTRLVDKTASFR